MEIYQETLRDLLAPDERPITMREDARGKAFFAAVLFLLLILLPTFLFLLGMILNKVNLSLHWFDLFP